MLDSDRQSAKIKVQSGAAALQNFVPSHSGMYVKGLYAFFFIRHEQSFHFLFFWMAAPFFVAAAGLLSHPAAQHLGCSTKHSSCTKGERVSAQRRTWMQHICRGGKKEKKKKKKNREKRRRRRRRPWRHAPHFAPLCPSTRLFVGLLWQVCPIICAHPSVDCFDPTNGRTT